MTDKFAKIEIEKENNLSMEITFSPFYGHYVLCLDVLRCPSMALLTFFFRDTFLGSGVETCWEACLSVSEIWTNQHSLGCRLTSAS